MHCATATTCWCSSATSSDTWRRRGIAALLLIVAALLLGACGERRGAGPALPAVARGNVDQGPWKGLPVAVRDQLARGVNAASWFTHRGDPQLMAGWPDASDFALMQKLGLRHVRVIFDPVWLNDSADHTRALSEGVHRMVEAGLLVVLALQPPAETKRRMASSDEPVQQAAATWRHLATVLKDIGDERLVFEVLNEPEVEDIARALAIQKQLVEAVRAISPERVAVVSGAHFSDIDDLVALQPLDLPRLIYSFHFYEPHNFTHQGASWGWPMWMVLRGLPYPSTPEVLAPVVATLTPAARTHAEWYGTQQWNRDKLATFVDRAAAWSQQHGVPIWCSEFGVLRDVAPPASRRAWTTDTRELFESRGIAWTHFDWWGHFGLVTGVPGARSVDEDVRVGLGLAAP